MKIIVIDLDSLKLPLKIKKKINSRKICTLLKRDFGKKMLIGLPKNDPECLKAHRQYEDAIFRLRDDDDCLIAENKMFRKIAGRIDYFRVGVVIRRDKALKILQALLGMFSA